MPCCAKSLHSCPTLWDRMNHSLKVSSVHGILQARIRELYMPLLGCHALLHGIFPTQGSNPSLEARSLSLLHWQMGSLPLVPPAKPNVGV